MNDYDTILKKYPSYISKEQLRILCRISKRMASFLLENALIPCTNSGKCTRKYKVAIQDVVFYLKDRENNPERYRPPKGTFAKQKKGCYTSIATPDISQERLAEYYEILFAEYPDILSLCDATAITGFVSCTLCKWIKAKRFRAFRKNGTYLIPKESLIGYMATSEYRRKPNQSHDYIEGFLKWMEKNPSLSTHHSIAE